MVTSTGPARVVRPVNPGERRLEAHLEHNWPRSVGFNACSRAAVTDHVGQPAEDLYEECNAAAEDRRAAQRAARSLAASVAKLHGTVALPVAAARLLAATDTDDYDVPTVIGILETDPALTGRLIRQVNAATAATGGCCSITQAVTLLGVRRLRSTALATSALEVFGQDEEPIAKSIAAHGVRTGELARSLAPHCGMAPDEMYVCGLLHDVGKLMLLRGADLDYREVVALDRPEGEAHFEERRRYGFDHALLGGHVLTSWKLPHPLPRVVAWHHQPNRAYRSQGKVPRMVALLRLADALASLDRTTTLDEVAMAFNTMPEELAVLGFSEEVRPRLCRELLNEAFDVMEAQRISAVTPIAPEEPEPEQEPAPSVEPLASVEPRPSVEPLASVEPPASVKPPLPTLTVASSPPLCSSPPSSPPEATATMPRKVWLASTLFATGHFLAGSLFGRLSVATQPTFLRFAGGLLLSVALLWALATWQHAREQRRLSSLRG